MNSLTAQSCQQNT